MKREMMVIIGVSLEVWSKTLTLEEIDRIVQCAHSKASREKNSSSKYPDTIWKVKSDARETDPLDQHLARLNENFPIRDIIARVKNAAEIFRCDLSIGICHDSYVCNFTLSETAISIMANWSVAIKLAFYPTSFEEDETVADKGQEKGGQEKGTGKGDIVN